MPPRGGEFKSPLRHISDREIPWSEAVFAVYQSVVCSCWNSLPSPGRLGGHVDPVHPRRARSLRM